MGEILYYFNPLPKGKLFRAGAGGCLKIKTGTFWEFDYETGLNKLTTTF
jgi:hypothetical protein